MKFFSNQTKDADESPERNESVVHGKPLEDLEKSRWERSWPTIACGAGLFSDGYLNGYALLIFCDLIHLQVTRISD